jgi:chemotaxis protein histidine kinase CheA
MTTFGRVEAEKAARQQKENASNQQSTEGPVEESQPVVRERETFEPSPPQDEVQQRKEDVRPWAGGQGYGEPRENVPATAHVSTDKDPEKENNGTREAFEEAKADTRKSDVRSNAYQASIQVPSLEAALEVVEKLVELATRYATGTEIDDHILRHIRALRESPRLLEELQRTLDLMFGGNVPTDAQAALGNWGLVRKLLDLLKSLGFNTQDLDFGTLLELAMLVIAIMKGEMSFTEIIDRITGLLSNREQQLKAVRG